MTNIIVNTFGTVAYTIQNGVYVTVGVAVPLWIAYGLVGLIVPLAFA